jgi:hypothetical protein
LKRNETKKQPQAIQNEQKEKPIIRVQSGLRAGVMSLLEPCC